MNLPQYGVVCILVMFFLKPLHGMNNPVVIDDISIAWSVLLECGTGAGLFNFAMINSLIVSKNHTMLLLRTAQLRKNYLLSKINSNEIKDGFLWNQWGSMCAERLPVHFTNLVQHQEDKRERYLTIQLYKLPDDTELAKNMPPIFITWNNFYKCLSHKPSLWFNEFGGVSFFGYGNVKKRDGDRSGDVLEYYASARGAGNISICVARLKGADIPLKMFLEFPYLLKAFLQSSQSCHEYEYTRVHSRTNVYDIEGVTIPKNYKEQRNYFSHIVYYEFAQLPSGIRKIIKNKYKQQKEKKKKLQCFFG